MLKICFKFLCIFKITWNSRYKHYWRKNVMINNKLELIYCWELKINAQDLFLWGLCILIVHQDRLNEFTLLYFVRALILTFQGEGGWELVGGRCLNRLLIWLSISTLASLHFTRHSRLSSDRNLQLRQVWAARSRSRGSRNDSTYSANWTASIHWARDIMVYIIWWYKGA